jgi:hypothetical protein
MRRAAALLLVGVVATTGCSGSAGPVPSGPGSTRPSAVGPGLGRVRSFREFALYWLGRGYGRLPLTGVTMTRVDIPNAAHSRILRTHSHVVDLSYGGCAAGTGDEGGCSPPLEIQNWPACGRNPALYGMPRPLRVHIRGAPAHHFGDRVEIWSGTTDIVIFSKHAARVAGALRSANGLGPEIGPGHRLPRPAPGAIDGRLRCIR